MKKTSARHIGFSIILVRGGGGSYATESPMQGRAGWAFLGGLISSKLYTGSRLSNWRALRSGPREAIVAQKYAPAGILWDYCASSILGEIPPSL